jgi:hypothetical protein
LPAILNSLSTGADVACTYSLGLFWIGW